MLFSAKLGLKINWIESKKHSSTSITSTVAAVDVKPVVSKMNPRELQKLMWTLQVQPRPAAVQQEGPRFTIHRWYLIYSVTRQKKVPSTAAHQNTGRSWSRSPAGGRSCYGTLPQISLCPRPTTTLTSQRCPAATPSRLCAAVARWDEGADGSHSRGHSLHGPQLVLCKRWCRCSPAMYVL